MKAKLYSREKTLKKTDLSFDQEITIGRRQGNNVVLDNKAVSKDHLRIFFDKTQQCFFLEDINSANGTNLDNIPVKGKEALRHLNVISIAGVYDFIFQDIQGCQSRHPDQKQAETPLKQDPQTVVQKGPFVTPAKFGKAKKEPVPKDGPKTIVASGPLSLPPDLGKTHGKSRPADHSETVIGDASFSLPPEFEKRKKISPPDHSETVVAGASFVLPPKLGKPEEQSKPEHSQTVLGDASFSFPPKFKEVKEDEAETIFSEKFSDQQEGQTLLGNPGLDLPESLVQTTRFAKADASLSQKRSSPREHFLLEVWVEGTQSQQFPLKEGENLIGRKFPADVLIETIEISRRHAILTLKTGSVYLKDAGSKNKTFVDGKEIVRKVEIQISTELRFGLIKARLVKA